jgi:hypothetical protein|tara:strand:- start:621 stop:1265 length:645 start_codon:yes stop_codon:yes gene_type:complete
MADPYNNPSFEDRRAGERRAMASKPGTPQTMQASPDDPLYRVAMGGQFDRNATRPAQKEMDAIANWLRTPEARNFLGGVAQDPLQGLTGQGEMAMRGRTPSAIDLEQNEAMRGNQIASANRAGEESVRDYMSLMARLQNRRPNLMEQYAADRGNPRDAMMSSLFQGVPNMDKRMLESLFADLHAQRERDYRRGVDTSATADRNMVGQARLRNRS